jgi:O-antigen/teichoic acid export membrane protein
MDTMVQKPPGVRAQADGSDAAKDLIRGSSLLLFGRGLSLVFSIVMQVVIVRYLSKTSFGAFAYALSLVQLAETISTFGLDRAVTRFLPIYEEREEHDKMFGTIVLVLGTILGLGLAIILTGAGLRAAFGSKALGGGQAVALLGILIALGPIQALDNVAMGMFAVWSRPGAIFFRKYLLEPVLQLSVVILLVTRGSPVRFLAFGYVVAGAIGLAVYLWMLYRMMSQRGLLRRFRRAGMRIPAREIFGFTLPLLSSDLLYGVMGSTDAIILAHYRGTTDVGAFRVVQPAARMNQFVMLAFTVLFTPVAARLFARKDRGGLRRAYGQTTVWMTVLSFPIFALTFSLARPVTTTLYGGRYSSSAIVLSMLSLGYFVSTASGFNGLTLKVVGKLRAIVVINCLGLVANLILNLFLIPAYGPLGAAVGTTATLIVHNFLKQGAVRLATGVRLFDNGRHVLYITIVCASLALLAVDLIVSPPLAVGLGLAALASIAVFAAGRSHLEVDATFPELMRFRILRLLAGKKAPKRVGL